MKEKISAFTNKISNKVKLLGLTLAVSAMMVMPAFATETETTVDVADALQEALNTVVVDFMGYVAIVLPIGLTIFGTVFGVKKGMQFFKTVSK